MQEALTTKYLYALDAPYMKSIVCRELVGRRIREARCATETDRKTLATAIGITLSTLSRIETGRISLSIERLAEISNILGIAMMDLFAEEKPARKRKRRQARKVG